MRNPTSSLSASTDPGTRESRYREWYGWRPATGRRYPRVAAGRRCVAESHDLGRRGDPCICQVHRGLLDHPATWRTARGTVYTFEPYGPVDGEALAAFVADARGLGLQVDVSARSAWSPGKTVLVEAYAADDMSRWLKTHKGRRS